MWGVWKGNSGQRRDDGMMEFQRLLPATFQSQPIIDEAEMTIKFNTACWTATELESHWIVIKELERIWRPVLAPLKLSVHSHNPNPHNEYALIVGVGLILLWSTWIRYLFICARTQDLGLFHAAQLRKTFSLTAFHCPFCLFRFNSQHWRTPVT